MDATLFISCPDYNDNLSFDVSNDFYRGNDYVKAMKDENTRNGEIVYNSMIDAKDGVSSLIGSASDSFTKFGAKHPQNEKKEVYSSSKCVLYDEDGVKETVDGLISHFVAQSPFIELVEFDETSEDDDFIGEITMWVREHNSVGKYASVNGDEWAWKTEPKRDMKMTFINKSGEKLYASLEGCKIMDIVGSNSMIIYINRLRLIDKF